MKNTKRLAIFSLFLVVALTVNSSFVLAADMTYEQIFSSSVVMKLASSVAYANGEQKAIDENKGVVPQLKADRTFVPLRFVSENFGADVSYNDADESVSITSGDSKILLTVGSADMTVNGEVVTLDAAPFVENDRTFVPIRAITESLGKKVFWHDSGLIVVGDNESISDENVQKLSELYAQDTSSAEVAEVEPYNYFTDEMMYKRTFAPGVVRPDECTFELTMKMDRTLDGLRSQLTPLIYSTSHKDVYGTPIVLFQMYPWLNEFVVNENEKTGMKFTVLNGTDNKNQLVCTNFANYEVGKPVNVAFTWKTGGKMAFYMNGQLLNSREAEYFFPENFLQYSLRFSNLERYGISQVKVSSKALDTTELSADPSAPFAVDDNTTMLVKGNMEDIKYYTSNWHRETNYSRLTAAFRADKQICTSDEKIVYPIMALNKTRKDKNYTVKLTATNSDGEVTVNRDVNITVPGDDNYHIYEASLPELTGNTGFYSIHAVFLDEGTEYDTLDSAIAVFPSNDESIADGAMSKVYGNEFTYDMPFSVFTKSNATVTRLQRLFYWDDIEPDKGYWDFSVADKYVERCKKDNIEILGVLGKTPYWAADESSWGFGMNTKKPAATVPKSLDDWSNYVYTVVSRYKDYVKTWEIWNEVDWMPPSSYASWNGTQEQYIELLGAAYKAVKRADPDATVTTSGFGNLNKGGIGWQIATKLLEEPYKTGYYDAFNGHGYGSADRYDDFLKEMNEKRPGTPIWMGEEMPMSADTDVQRAYSMVNKYIGYTQRGFCKFVQMCTYDLFTGRRNDSPSYAYQCMAALQQLIRKCDTLEGTYDDFKGSQYLGLKHYYKRTDGKYLSIFGSDAVKGNVYFTNDNVKVYSDVGKEIQPSAKDGAKGVYINVAAYVVSDEPLNLVNFENGGSKELLSDGGFENVGGDLAFGDLYPISWTEVVDADKGGDINMKEDSKSGTYALYLKSTADSPTGITQLSPLKDPGEYSLTLSAKRIGGDKNSKITVGIKDVKTGEVSTGEITGIGSDWKTSTVDFDISTAFEDGAQIEITSVGDAEILVDEVSLGIAAGSDEFAGNLVANYSFDNGLDRFDISNQTQTGYVEIVDNGITGKSAKVVSDGGQIKVVSTVSANVAGRYKYTARFKRIKGRNVIPYVFIYDVVADKINSVKVTELYGYKYVTATVYMDIAVPASYVRVAAGIDSGAGEILVDDVSFTLVTD